MNTFKQHNEIRCVGQNLPKEEQEIILHRYNLNPVIATFATSTYFLGRLPQTPGSGVT